MHVFYFSRGYLVEYFYRKKNNIREMWSKNFYFKDKYGGNSM